MASITGICSSPTPKPQKLSPKSFTLHRKDLVPLPLRPRINADRSLNSVLTHSVARDTPAELSKTSNGGGVVKGKKGLEKDPRALWKRYVDWLYQHKELGLYLDVSRIGFTEEFLEQMEPKFQAAFRAMNFCVRFQ